MKQTNLLMKTFLLCALLAGSIGAWAETETLTGSDDTGSTNTGITKTSFTMLGTYDPSGKRTINSKSCLKVRWNQKNAATGNINGFALKVNQGYKITGLTMQISGNGKTGTLDGISIDGSDYSGSYDANIVSSDNYTNITLSDIEATDYINFKQNSGSAATQLFVYITVTYEAVSSDAPLSTSVTPASAFVTVGNTQQLTGSFTGGVFDGVWESDNTSVATVTNTGLVTAVALGTSHITYGWDNANNDGSEAFNASATIVVLPLLTEIWSTDFTAISEDGAPYTETTFGSTYYNLENVNSNFGVVAKEGDGGKNSFYVHNGALYVFYGGTRQFAINNLVEGQYIRITASDAVNAISGVELKGVSGNVKIFQATASGIGVFSSPRYNNIYKVEVLRDYYPPTIATQPIDASYKQKATASALTILASAAKGGELSYQWYSNTINATEGAVAIDGATSSSYTPSTTTAGTTYYYCVVTEAENIDVATSTIVSIEVHAPAELSATSGSIALTESWKTGSVTVSLTGEDLNDGEYNVIPDDNGVTISPAKFTVSNGAVSQEFTLTSTATTAATTVITFGTEAMGADVPTYTLTYSQASPKRSVSQTDVTEATTWDWTKCGSASIELKNDGTTIPANGEEFVLAELPEITNDDNFNSQALKVTCQWPNRGNNYYFQGTSVKFNVTVPGTVQVWFSNTSNRADNAQNRRFLYINGTNSNEYTLDQNFTNTPAMPVDAGEVVINAYTGEETPASTMVRINKIVFIPAPTPEPATPIVDGETVTLSTTENMDGWRSFYDATQGYTVDDATKVYIATAKDESKVTIAAIQDIPAGTPVILKTSNINRTMTLTKAASTTSAATGNLLEATTAEQNIGENCYRLGYGAEGIGFYPWSTSSASAGIVYINTNAGSRSLTIVFDDETTGVSASLVNTKNGDMYDLQGRKVANPVKGLYIVNGKKVIIK